MKLENIVPITELRRNAAGLVKQATDEQSPIIITQNGRATAVLQDIHSYNRERQSRAMLILAMQGERDIHEGRVMSHAESRKRIKAMLERARAKSGAIRVRPREDAGGGG
jgi:prevent-host-death family protein